MQGPRTMKHTVHLSGTTYVCVTYVWGAHILGVYVFYTVIKNIDPLTFMSVSVTALLYAIVG